MVIQPRFCSDGDIRADATNGTHLEQSKISLGRSVGSLDCMRLFIGDGYCGGLLNGNCMYMVHTLILYSQNWMNADALRCIYVACLDLKAKCRFVNTQKWVDLDLILKICSIVVQPCP